MRPLLNGGTLIWNDGSSSNGGFSSFSDLLLLSFVKVEVNESADEVGGFRRLITLIFEDRPEPPSWS